MRDPVIKLFTAAISLLRFPKTAAAAVLEQEFAKRRKLPELPPGLCRKIHSCSVIVPALQYMQSGTQDVQGLIGLVSIAKIIGAKSIFEIGTFTGLTTLALAMNLPEATIHTLDLPGGEKGVMPADPYDEAYLPKSGERRVYENFPSLMARIVQHEADSAKFNFEKVGQTFDLVYIDGAHSYEYVRNDTDAAYRIIVPAGVIVWDDYSRAWPEVADFLDGAFRPGTYCLPGLPRRLAVWFGDLTRITAVSEAGAQEFELQPIRSADGQAGQTR